MYLCHVKSINPSELTIPELQGLLQGAVSPRPIAFAATIDINGNHNLAPFSFFNIFSANPPILVFSPANSGRTGAKKDTLNNVLVVPEVVVNTVNYAMVEKMSVASSPYPADVDEFEKAGLTAIPSENIKPMRVAESPVQMECKVLEVKALGEGGGAGNLVICEIVKIHLNEGVLNAEGKIDPNKIDLVARMGGNWYCRASGNGIFEIEKPITTCGIGVDKLPDKIKNNPLLNSNNIGRLANIEGLPSEDEINNAPTLAPEHATSVALMELNKNNKLHALCILLKNT